MSYRLEVAIESIEKVVEELQEGNFADSLASVLAKRLREVKRPWILSLLKKELQDWNMAECKWKEPKS